MSSAYPLEAYCSRIGIFLLLPNPFRIFWTFGINWVSGGGGCCKILQNLTDFFLIFIYEKRLYILKACVEWNFSQNLILGLVGGAGGSNKNVLAGKILKKDVHFAPRVNPFLSCSFCIF